jgi:2-keto-4-pentenoate hydratase/2-oxohepta-3-ene-1,7-dioic acid hydratase in catechol pathway
MKYCRFQSDAGPQYGEVFDRNGTLWIERILPPPPEDAWTQLAGPAFEPIPLGRAVLLPPVTPSKIVCVGRNYRDHAKELGNDIPSEPLIFFKPPSSLLPMGGVIQSPKLSERVDYEGELGVVIGKTARNIQTEEEIGQYIRGYTIVNDVTARDLQSKDGQWTRAKGFDTFCPVGPLVTDELDLQGGVNLETRLNGEVRQQASTLDFIFPLAVLLRYITSVMTLLPGDLIATGTPAGVGPMLPGDQVSITIPGIGALTNTVA